MKKFKKTISRGLPGGPNEEITEITGAISVEGYKINSPDKDNTFNIIPSSNISMKDVEFPILGTDNLGNSQVMMPGAQYTFPGDMVVELPMMADGGRCWPGYKPVSGKMAYSKGSCEKAEDGLELPLKQRGGNTLDDKIAFPLAKKLAAAADATSDFITEKTDDIYNMIKPEITQEDRQFIFDNVRPLSYPTLTTMATTGANLLLKKAGFDTTTPPALDSDGDYQIGDEAWAKSLGVPTKDKYIVPQEEYKPSSAKDSDAKYFKLHDDVIDYTKIMKELSSQDVDHVQYFESLAPFLKKGFMDETEFEQIDPLQNFKVSVGYDEDKKQKYISIYDKYDFKGALNNVIKPYEFYDRYYLPKEQEGGEQQTRSQLRDQILQLYKQLEEEQNRVNDIRSRVPQVSEEIDIADSKIIERINNPVTKDDQKLVELWENYKYANNPTELAAARNALPQEIKDVLPEEGKYNVASYSYKDDTWKGGQDPSRELYCTPFGCFPYQKAGATDVNIIGGNYTFTEGAYGSGYKTAGNVPFEKVSVEDAEPGDIAIQYNSAPLEYTMTDAPRVFRPHHTTILNKKAEYDDGTPYIEVYNAQGGSRLYFGKDEFELGPNIESGDDRNEFSEQHEFYRYVGQTPKIQKQIDDLKELYMQAPEEKIPTLSTLKGETVNLNIPNQIQAEPLNTRVIIPQSTSKRKKRRQYGAEILEKQNDILRRQAFAESSFNPSAESPAGAQGLTQFTPTTVKELQRLGFVNEDFDIFNPQQAVEAQKAYMKYIQSKPFIAKGTDEVQLAKALYAYNRGPSGALKNLTKLKGKYDIYNSLDWLEGINAESRDYIQKILGQNPEFNIQYKQALESKDYRPIVDLYQAGGESNMFKIYKDFIMGEFDTSESYPEAEKVFDRLNRVYYKEAKEAGMSPANYIMTNIVTS